MILRTNVKKILKRSRRGIAAVSKANPSVLLLKANVKEAVSSLYAAKQRTLLALIGIVIGIGSVIAMISVGEIVKSEALAQFQELGTDILTIRNPDAGGVTSDRQATATIRLADALELPVKTESILAAAPSTHGFGEFVYAGKRVGDGAILGVTASFSDLNKLFLTTGRFISDLDFRRYYCVIGGEIAQAMQRAGARRLVGETIKLAGRLYTVVGVLQNTPGWGMRQFNTDRSVFVPITTAQRAFSEAEIESVIARMQPQVHYMAATEEVQTYFRHKAKGLEVEVESARQLIEQMEKQMQLFTLLLGAIGSISLIVGGVGVMNVMLVSVTERRKEIGIRRALGARRGDIQSQFLMESLILSLIGGLFGVALGIGASYTICHFTDWTFLVSTAAVILGFGVASAVGIFFGFYPAYQAARLDPITALRAE